MIAEFLTRNAEFHLLDLYTSPPDVPPSYHSTMAGYIYKDLWELWQYGLIERNRLGGIRVTQEGKDYLELTSS